MKITSFVLRNKFRFLFYGFIALVSCYAVFIEPNWVATRHIKLSAHPTVRLVHISDIHYHGEKRRLQRVVDEINRLAPDLVCFTGDLVDKKEMAPEALSILTQIRCPVFGVPGNHEYWSGIAADDLARAFEKTGGAFLADQRLVFNNLEIIGTAGEAYKPVPRGKAARKSLLLAHYPALAKTLGAEKFGLILAGHSHGGQVRLPWLGALTLPYAVDGLDRGLYQTPSGTLYVTPGLGTYGIPVRFFCRPEIAQIEF
ncbi:MAG: metallophosphoesterase [Thermodesulfobacteriota bacterium]